MHLLLWIDVYIIILIRNICNIKNIECNQKSVEIIDNITRIV
nr:MAG TPA: hypothetical protein [Caudoviricetes sp.]